MGKGWPRQTSKYRTGKTRFWHPSLHSEWLGTQYGWIVVMEFSPHQDNQLFVPLMCYGTAQAQRRTRCEYSSTSKCLLARKCNIALEWYRTC